MTNLLNELETKVDVYGIAAVLCKLAEMASEKADHVRTNWQDERLAKDWDTLAARLLNDENWIRERSVIGA